MKTKFSIGLAVIAVLIVTGSAPGLSQPVEITTKGYATIYGSDRAAARDRALEDAQRKAVEQALGTMISSASISRNFQLIEDRIFSLSSGYIETYRIVSETERDNELEVEIAAVVGMEKLSDSLQAIQTLIRRVEKPKIMVLIAEQSILAENPTSPDSAGETALLSATRLGVAETAVIEYLRGKGFQFVDRQALSGQIEVADPLVLINDTERIRKVADLTKAQVVIFGQAQARTTGEVQGIHSGQANIALRALKTDTGEIIAASSTHAAVAHVDPSTANAKALSDASRRIAGLLLDQILSQWQNETGGTRTVTLRIEGVSYAEVKQLRSWLPQQVRGVREVYQRSVQNNTAELDIDLQGSAENLADELSEKQFKDRTIEVLDLLPNKVRIELK
jgi:hypothetical protein